MYIQLEQPLNLVHTLECGQAFRWQRADGWYYGVIFDNIIRIRQALFGLEFNSYPQKEEDVAYRLKYYLRLDDDLLSIYDKIRIDDRMRKAIAQFYGLSLLRQDPWECLFSFICSINSNIARISASVENLCRRLGKPLEMGNQVRHSFPTPEQIAGVGETGLRIMGMGFRAKYMAATAGIVSSGDYDLEALREMPYEDAKKELMLLPGVGDKVADCVLLFSLDKLESFPIDRWVRRAVEEWYLGGEILPYQAVREWALQTFGGYAGYAQQYLFHRKRLEGSATVNGKEHH